MFASRALAVFAMVSLCALSAQDDSSLDKLVSLHVSVRPNGDVQLTAFASAANLGKIIRETFPCNWRNISADERYFSGTCKKLLKSDGARVEDTLRLAGLTSALQTAAGVNQISVSVNVGGEQDAAKDRPEIDPLWKADQPGRRRAARSYYRFATDSGENPPDLPVRAGHRFQPGRLLIPLLLVLLIPPLAAWLLMRSKTGQAAGNKLVWLNWMILGTWIYWISTASIPDLMALCMRIAPDQAWLMGVAGVAFFALPVLAAICLCLLITHPPATKTQLVASLKRSMAAQALGFVPLSFFVIAIVLFETDATVAGAMILGAFLSHRALTWIATRWTYSQLRLVSSGALRNRVSAIAAKANVKVTNLYLLRNLVPREVNAFATSGGNVMLTESMLRALPRREIDAVMAHEIGHLKGRHIAARAAVMWAMILVGGPLTGLLVSTLRLPIWVVELPLFPILYVLLMAQISQRNEYSADAQAVQLTGDPEAKIAALARLAKLTESPVNWGGIQGSILSHPSMQARVLALARRFNVPDLRALAILDDPNLIGGESYDLDTLGMALQTAPRPEGAAGTYELPADLAAGDPLFNTGVKQRFLVSALWTAEILIVALPAALLSGLHMLPLAAKQQFLLFLAGLAVCFLIRHAVERGMWAGFYRRLKNAIGWRLKNPDGAGFVGLYPGAQARSFEGFSDWDLGFLSAGCGSLTYRGEQVRFQLQPQWVTGIDIVSGPPSWSRDYRVVVRWSGGAFSVRHPGCYFAKRNAIRLKDTLDRWWLSATPPNTPGEIVLPALQNLTNQQISRWKLLIRVGVLSAKVFAGSLILNMIVHAPLPDTFHDSESFAWTILLQLGSLLAAPLLMIAMALPLFLPQSKFPIEEPRPVTAPPTPIPAEMERTSPLLRGLNGIVPDGLRTLT